MMAAVTPDPRAVRVPDEARTVYLLGGPKHGTMAHLVAPTPELLFPDPAIIATVYLTEDALAKPTARVVRYAPTGLATGDQIPIWTPDGAYLDRWRGVGEVWQPQGKHTFTIWFRRNGPIGPIDYWPEAINRLTHLFPGRTVRVQPFGAELLEEDDNNLRRLWRFTAQPWLRLHPADVD